MLLLVANDTALVTPCQAAEGDLWFGRTPEEVEDAKARCRPCPLRQACLSGALARREPWGVWGGQLLADGRVLARKVPMGRPRKDDRRRTAA